MNLTKIKSMTDQCKGMQLQLTSQLENLKKQKEKINHETIYLEKAQLFLQKVAQDTQEHLRFQVEDIVNLALETCFPGEYEFHIMFDIMRGKTEAELVFLDKKTGKKVDPMNASGGGVVDLASFALRIACYSLERGNDNVIILDEPFRFLSRDLQSRAGHILKTLSEKMNLQIIMVTHIGDIIDCANKIFEIKKGSDGISEVRVRL